MMNITRVGVDVDVVAQHGALQIDLDDAGQMRFGHGVVEPCRRPAVRKRSAAAVFPEVLRVELVGPGIGLVDQCRDAFVAPAGLRGGRGRAVRHNQAQVVPALFGDHLRLRVLALGLVESPQLLQRLFLAPPRHRDDELQRMTVAQADAPRFQVVETRQAAVGDQN